MKKILALAMMIMALGTAAYADPNVEVITQKGSTVIEAQVDLGEENAYKLVSFSVRNKKRQSVYMDAALTDKDGKYTFKFNHTGASGNYTLYFNAPDISYTSSETLDDFKGNDYYQTYFDDINAKANSKDIAGLQTAVEEYAAQTDWDMSAYSSMTDKTVLYTLLANDATEYSSLEALKNDFDIAYSLAECIVNKDSAALYAFYLNDLTTGTVGLKKALPAGKTNTVIDDLKSDIADKVFAAVLSGEITSRQDLKNALLLRALITPIKEATHYEDVKTVVEAYTKAGRISVDTANSHAVAAYKKMMNIEYTSENAVEIGYKTALESLSESSKPSGGGGGGGGGVSYIPTSTVEKKDDESTGNDSTQSANTPKMSFADMEDAKWALDAVEAMHKRGVISGTGNGNFEPHKRVTRAEFAQMAVLLAGYTGDGLKFSDVNDDAWYAKAVSAACANGLFVGFEDGSFGPDTAITREQLALVAYRMLEGKASFGEFEIGGFADDDMIDPGFKEAVYALKSRGFISGRSADTFCPDEYVTRVEAAVLLNNISMYF